MVDFVGFSDGYRKQQETGERKRLELAKAFQEFQRQNPTANPMEFQAFIDSMAGGSNYLRGGMPSGDMLKAITDQADIRRANADADRERGILEKNIQLQTSLEGAATGIMLGYNDPGDNGYELKDFNAMSEKLKERFPGVDFDKIGFDPTTMFTGDRRRSAIAARVGEYLPTVTQLVQNAGGKGITEEDLKAFNIPTALVQPLLTQASQLEDERRDVFARTRGAEIAREAEKAIANNTTDVYGHLSQIFGEANLPGKDSTIMLQYIEQATTAHNNAVNLRDRETRDLTTSFTNNAMADVGLRSSLFLGDAVATQEAMLEFAKKALTPSDFFNVFGKPAEGEGAATAADFAPYVENMIAGLSIEQRKEITDARRNAEAGVGPAVDQFKKANADRVRNRFGDPSKEKTPPNAGIGGRNAILAAERLAQVYSMTPQVLAAMENVFQSFEEDEQSTLSPEFIEAAVLADPAFQNAAQNNSLADGIENIRTSTIDRLGRFDASTFADWSTQTSADIETSVADTTSDIEAAMTRFGDNPQALVQALEAINSELNNGLTAFEQELNLRAQRAKEFTGWIIPGSGAWDDSQVFGGANTIEGQSRSAVNQLREEIARQLAVARQKIKDEIPQVEDGEVGVDKASTDGTVIGNALNNWAYNSTVNRQLREDAGFMTDGTALNFGDYANPFKLIGKIGEEMFSSPAEAERRDGVRDWLDANNDRINEWASNIMQSEDEFTRTHYTTLRTDLATMTPQQLEAKYRNALDTLGDPAQRKIVLP